MAKISRAIMMGLMLSNHRFPYILVTHIDAMRFDRCLRR